MKPDIRWQALLALAGLALVMMLLSYQVQSASLCTVSVPSPGGVFIEGMVGRPLALNPLLSDPYPVDRDLVNLIFDGLVSYDEGGQVVPALAESWTMSEDNLMLTLTLREGMEWHDGQPVTTADVAFTYALLQDEGFPGSSSLRSLWQSVTITIIDDRRIQFTLAQPYSPFIEALTRGILPQHLLGDITAADLLTMPFNQAPIGTGPFMVHPGQDWSRSGSLRLTPNPTYWREGTLISDLEFRFFPNAEDMVGAYHAGEIHAINELPATMLPNIVQEESSRLFTSIAPRYSALFFNLSETGFAALRTKEVRQALAYGLNRNALVDWVINGQGVGFEGPYLPGTWMYRSDLLTTYPHQPDTAAALLDTAGWVRGGDGVRAREGAPLSLRLGALDAPEHRAVAEEIARQWAESGVGVQLNFLPDLDTLSAVLKARDYDVVLLEIAPPKDPDLYDFWSQEAIVRGQNFTGWNNRRASEALENGRQLFAQGERALQYEAFLRHFDGDLPALTLYQHVTTYVMSDSVNQAEMGRIWQPRDRYQTLASWFLNFRDITVSCPAQG